MKIANAKTLPLILYGLHFAPGVAEYQDNDRKAYRVLINEDTAKKMDRSFASRPVYVEHVDGVNLENLQEEADGYVVESFYNKLDGKHWVKMILVSDRAQEAYKNGYQLSNAYLPKSFRAGGQWHGVSYEREITDGEYEHMALVRDPRYSESLILTTEEFKHYNSQKESELSRFANSKETDKMKLNIFRRAKVENSKEVDFDQLEVELPKSKQVVTLAKAIDGYDAVLNMSGYAAPDHMVKYNDKEECSVADLVKRHNDMEKELSEMKGKDDKMENELEADPVDEEPTKEDVLENAADPGDEKDEAGGDEDDGDIAARKENSKDEKKKNFDKLKNAHKAGLQPEPITVMTTRSKVALGQKRYGSN